MADDRTPEIGVTYERPGGVRAPPAMTTEEESPMQEEPRGPLMAATRHRPRLPRQAQARRQVVRQKPTRSMDGGPTIAL